MTDPLLALVIVLLLIIGLWAVVFTIMYFAQLKVTHNRMDDLQNSMTGVEQFTVRLDSSPQYRGSVGEHIVRLLLAELPMGTVEEQVSVASIPGRPDFVISLPNVTEKLVVDAKMSFPDKDMHDNKFRSILVKRAQEITKYIVPGTTFDFVLMWIPDGAYYKIDDPTAKKLFILGVVPVTTPTMLGVIHLLRRAHRAFELNSMSTEFVTFVGKAQTEFSKTQNGLDKARTQIANGLKNLDQMAQNQLKMDHLFENFEEAIK